MSETRVINVLYHSNCYDGFGAMWATRRFLEQEYPHRDIRYQPAEYGVDYTFENSMVIYVDFCPKRGTIERISRDNLVLILDHHKTAQADTLGLPTIDRKFSSYLKMLDEGNRGVFCKFDMDQSGAGISYRYFHDDNIPPLIKYIEDRDLWRFRYPDTRAFHNYLLSRRFDYSEWNDIHERSVSGGIDAILGQGNQILEYNKQLVANICKNASIHQTSLYKYGYINTNSHWSEVGEYMLEHFNLDVSIGLTIDFKLGLIKGSIRSRPTIDITPLAQKFGGGGHKNACGFTVAISRGLVTLMNDIEDFMLGGA